jgi:predicted XRE-type DNA-binding protein
MFIQPDRIRQLATRDEYRRLWWHRPIEAEAFEGEEMRRRLANRDIAGVYELLQHRGISQRRIAAQTGQSQSEISEILAGRRVQSYDVLVRIAEGLGVPHGWMGLAYDTEDGEPPEQ